MRAAIAALFVLLFAIASCGGGGSGPRSGGAIVPALEQLRTDLLFGYYGDCDTCALETRDHVNLYWAANWRGLADTMRSLFNARAAGIHNIVLAVPAYAPNAEAEVRFYLDSLKAGGYLVGIRALYPIDEPDVNGKSDAEVREANAMLRRVMADYPELEGAALAVIYGAGDNRPGIGTYDWVGFDDYDRGCAAVLGDEYAALKGRLRPEQRILVVPGGADPWRRDPACFEWRAHSDPQVVALVPFVWFDNYEPGRAGIRSNPTRSLYCDAGRKILGAPLCSASR